jgi:hypothetical protein
MAATDHTRLRTARPSADTKSTDTSRSLSAGMEAPSGADPVCDAETAPREALHGSMDSQSIERPASTSAVPGSAEDARFARSRIRRQVGKVCDYLELGSSLATVASRTAFASIYADDRSLSNHLADLADLIEEQVACLRSVAGIERASSAGGQATLSLPLEMAETMAELAPGAAKPPESPS